MSNWFLFRPSSRYLWAVRTISLKDRSSTRWLKPVSPTPEWTKGWGEHLFFTEGPKNENPASLGEFLVCWDSLSCTGEGNGNPLQCSCLENPRDRGAWWAAVYGVTWSRTRLKWLSSSSSVLRTKYKQRTPSFIVQTESHWFFSKAIKCCFSFQQKRKKRSRKVQTENTNSKEKRKCKKTQPKRNKEMCLPLHLCRNFVMP